MPLLQVRDFPQDLYELLSRRAEEENRSITQQTIYMLKMMLNNNVELSSIKKKEERKMLLDKISALNLHLPKDAPSAAELIRKDRER